MRSNSERAKQASRPWLWPLLLVITGIALLLDNFLLLGDFNAAALLPLLLVVAGAQILLRGDLLPSTEARTFGITRGSVQSGTMEISSGAIDVQIRALQREGRLIAGQYAAESRPDLVSDDNHAHLKMKRSQTPWVSFTDWQIGVADDLPWQVFVSTHLGKATLDLSNIVVQEALVATGLGDIYLTSPYEAFGRLHLQSSLGIIHITTPQGYCTRIETHGGRFFKTYADEKRYDSVEPNVYISKDADEDAPLVEIYIRGTFGDAYLA